MAVFFGHAAPAADPLSYTVNFTPSGDATLDSLLRQTSALVSMRQKLPAGPLVLIARARADARQFAVVLHSLGYDDGRIAITIGGDTLANPALPGLLANLPASQGVTVRIIPHQGPVFRLGQVQTPGLPPGFKPPPGMVRPGQPALAAPILAVVPALCTALRNAGYAFAVVSQPLAVAHPAAQRLDVTYTITPGPLVAIGPVAFAGLTRTSAAFLRAHIALKPGQPFSDTALAQARDSLLGLGVFASVTPLPASKPTARGLVPVTFRVVPKPRHAVTLSALYASDTGLTLGTSWEDRDVFTHAERLKFTAAGNGLAATGTRAPGYDLQAVFAKPDFAARGQILSLSLEALNESLTAYSRKALLARLTLSRPFGAHLSLTYGPQFITEQVRQQGVNRDYALAQLPATLTYSTAENLLEPTQGLNAGITATPTLPTAGTGKPFLIMLASASVYLPVEPAGRGVVALHGQVGSIQGASVFQVPPDQRFYAGGSGTVRGYTYQTIGPLFPDGTPEGGLAMDAGSLEFRQRVGKSFGLVPFIDAGQVNSGSRPFAGTLRVGAGLGLRYYTSIGPIRLDLAFPFTRVAGSAGFALYVGFGESF